MLAKFDATANDAEDEELVEEGFPILVMYHAKTNDRVVYQGDIDDRVDRRNIYIFLTFRQERL